MQDSLPRVYMLAQPCPGCGGVLMRRETQQGCRILDGFSSGVQYAGAAFSRTWWLLYGVRSAGGVQASKRHGSNVETVETVEPSEAREECRPADTEAMWKMRKPWKPAWKPL